MTDERLRVLERQTLGDPTDMEARQALLAAQVRAGHVTRENGQNALVNALRARVSQRMASLRAVPLGPVRAVTFHGGEYGWPEVTVGEGLRAEVLLPQQSPWLEKATDQELEAWRGETQAIVGGREGEWVWVFPSRRLNDAIVQGNFVVTPRTGGAPTLFRMTQSAADGSCYRVMRTRVWTRPSWRWEVLPPITRQAGLGHPGHFSLGSHGT